LKIFCDLWEFFVIIFIFQSL